METCPVMFDKEPKDMYPHMYIPMKTMASKLHTMPKIKYHQPSTVCQLCDIGIDYGCYHLMRHRMCPSKADLFRENLMNEAVSDINMHHVAKEVEDVDFFTFNVEDVFEELEDPPPFDVGDVDTLSLDSFDIVTDDNYLDITMEVDDKYYSSDNADSLSE